MEQLSPQIKYALARFPRFELSYETISHTKVYSTYDIGMAIPHGKKGYLWFTFDKYHDVCYLFEINREKKIVKGSRMNVGFDRSLAIGTVLYGTLIADETGATTAFIIEDVTFYRGVPLDTARQIDKLCILQKLFVNFNEPNTNNIRIMLPVMWQTKFTDTDIAYPDYLPDNPPPYNVHHIQYRSSTEKMPFVNVFVARKGVVAPLPTKPIIAIRSQPEYVPIRPVFTKPQYKYPAIFHVTADIQFDIYHLFAFGKNNQRVYYNVAYIPNYKTSVFMNGLFRNIRENKNLDYIEESDDEDDFQNMNEDKYVDMKKTILIECIFDRKFKKWTPVQVVDKRSKVVHISQL